MATFGRRAAFDDEYGQRLEVNVDEGNADVDLSWDDPVNTLGSRHQPHSALTPDQADNLAEQLRAAAAYARGLEPHR